MNFPQFKWGGVLESSWEETENGLGLASLPFESALWFQACPISALSFCFLLVKSGRYCKYLYHRVILSIRWDFVCASWVTYSITNKFLFGFFFFKKSRGQMNQERKNHGVSLCGQITHLYWNNTGIQGIVPAPPQLRILQLRSVKIKELLLSPSSSSSSSSSI